MHFYDDEKPKSDRDLLWEKERELEQMQKAIEMLITVGHLDRSKYEQVLELVKQWR